MAHFAEEIIPQIDTPHPKHPERWQPPQLGWIKINSDGGRVGDGRWVWGFVARNDDGGVLLAGRQQGQGFTSAQVEEARAILFALKAAQQAGFLQVIVESDCLNLTRKLQKGKVEDNHTGIIIQEILEAVTMFDSIAWTFVKRKGNRVAHSIAHLHSLIDNFVYWSGIVPAAIIELAAEDMELFNLAATNE